MYPSNTQDPAPVKEIKIKEPGIIGFHIDNEPTKADYIFINNLLSAHLTDRTELRLYLRLDKLIDIEINYIFDEFESVFDSYKKKTKVAIVADKNLKPEINQDRLVSAGITLNYFPLADKAKAINWLNEKIE